jgi:hypothetical protein
MFLNLLGPFDGDDWAFVALVVTAAVIYIVTR